MKYVYKQYQPAQFLKPFDIVVGNKSYGNYRYPKIVLRNQPSKFADNFDVLFYDFEDDKIKKSQFYRMKFFLVKYEN